MLRTRRIDGEVELEESDDGPGEKRHDDDTRPALRCGLSASSETSMGRGEEVKRRTDTIQGGTTQAVAHVCT